MSEQTINLLGNNLSRSVQAIEKLDNSSEILKALAPQINWNEESQREITVNRHNEKYKDKTRAVLYTELSEAALSHLIAEPMFKSEYYGYEEIPYHFCMAKSKFNFLNDYLKEFSSYLNQKNDIDGLTALSFENNTKSQFLQSILAVIKETHKNSVFSRVAFDTKSVKSINVWFEGLNKSFKILQTLNPILNPVKANIAITNGEGKEESLQAAINKKPATKKREKEQIAHITQTVQTVWFTLLYLANPKNINQNRASLNAEMEGGQEMTFSDNVVPFLYQAIQNLEKDDTFSSHRVSIRSINSGFLNFIAGEQNIEEFRAFIEELSSFGEKREVDKKKSDLILEHITKDIFKRFSYISKKFFMGRSSMSYGQKEQFLKECKSHLNYFSTMAQKVEYLFSKPECKAWIEEEFKANEGDNDSSLSINALQGLAEQAPLSLLEVSKMFPSYQFNLAGEKRNCAQTAFLYQFIHEAIYQAKILKNRKEEFIDYKDSVGLDFQFKKEDSGGGNKWDEHYSFAENYNVRRRQLLSVDKDYPYLPDFSALEPLTSTLTNEEKQKIIGYVKLNFSEALKLPGLEAMGFIIEDINALKITLEKMVLNFKINEPLNDLGQIKNVKKNLKI